MYYVYNVDDIAGHKRDGVGGAGQRPAERQCRPQLPVGRHQHRAQGHGEPRTHRTGEKGGHANLLNLPSIS